MAEDEGTQEIETGEEDGARSFTRMLERVDEGDCERECARMMQKLVRVVQNEARMKDGPVAGGFTLSLGVVVDEKGVTGITYDVKIKEPKKKRSPTIFWANQDANLQNTPVMKQEDLFPREVRGKAVEAPGEKKPVEA